MSTDYSKDVKIVHFSAVPKPRDKVFSKVYEKMDERKFLYDIIFTNYMRMFGKERPNHAKGPRNAEEIRTMLEFVPIAFKLRDDTINSGVEWFKFYRVMVQCLNTQTWTTLSGDFRDFSGLLDAAVRRKYAQVLPGHNPHAPVKNRTQDQGSQYENNKVFLEITHGDQDFAEALFRLASPSLVGRCNKEMELGGATYRPRVEAWAAIQSMECNCAKNSQIMSGAR